MRCLKAGSVCAGLEVVLNLRRIEAGLFRQRKNHVNITDVLSTLEIGLVDGTGECLLFPLISGIFSSFVSVHLSDLRNC